MQIDIFLLFENDAQRKSNKRCYTQNVEIKDYNVMIDRKNVFDQTVKNNKVTYENIRKMAAGHGEYDTTGCLLDYIYFKKILQNDCSRFKQRTSTRC